MKPPRLPIPYPVDEDNTKFKFVSKIKGGAIPKEYVFKFVPNAFIRLFSNSTCASYGFPTFYHPDIFLV